MKTIITSTILAREPQATAQLRKEVNTSAMKFLTDVLKWAGQKAQDEGKNPEIEQEKVLSLGWVKFIVTCNKSRWAGKANLKPKSSLGPEVLQKAETFEKKFKEVKPAKKVVKAEKVSNLADYLDFEDCTQVLGHIAQKVDNSQPLPALPEKYLSLLEESFLYHLQTGRLTMAEYKATVRYTEAFKKPEPVRKQSDPRTVKMIDLFV